MIPRANARNADGSGMCLLKIPIVPKISMDETIITIDLLSLRALSVVLTSFI